MKKPFNPYEHRKAKKLRQLARIAEEKKREQELEEQFARQTELRKAETWKHKLFGSGTVTAKNPTGRYGYVFQVLMLLIGVPVLGVLYKLSMTWLAIPMILIAYGVAKLIESKKRRRK